MKLATAILAKHEAAPDRYLARVVERCCTFSDAVLLLDDRSTDGTAKLASSLGCQVRTRSVLHEPAWGQETPARVELWDWGVTVARDLDPANAWLLICDADMLLHGDPRPLGLSWDAGAWAWPLADLWDDETRFREDGPWGL